jgi:glycerol-3-phosphate dehydrogenase (NAD(P)+)
MPIVSGLYEIIYNDLPIIEVAANMMNSGQRSDVEFVLPNR